MRLLFNLTLGNQALLAVPSLTRATTAISSSADGGDLAGQWGNGRGHSAFEVNVNVFNSVKLGVLFLVSTDRSFNSIQGRALNAILEPVDLQGLVERFNTVLSQVRMGYAAEREGSHTCQS